MDALNDEFRRLFVSSGWSQARSAVELRLDAATISRYLSGEVRPSGTVLRLFSEILGERLILPGQDMPQSLRDSPRRLEVYESRLLDALRKLDPEPRKKLIDAVSLISDAAQMIRAKASHRAKQADVSETDPPDGTLSFDGAVELGVAAGAAALEAAGIVSESSPKSGAAGPSADRSAPSGAGRAAPASRAAPRVSAPSSPGSSPSSRGSGSRRA